MEANGESKGHRLRLRKEERAIYAAWGSFAVGFSFGMIALAGGARPIAPTAGDLNVTQTAAGIAAIISAAAFVLSTLLHRRHETDAMPSWQRRISHVSTVALTVSFGAVAYMGVLTGGEILAMGLQGLELPAIGGALLTAIASAAAGWLAFEAGIELRTRDLATLLFGFLTIGTLFAMITAADPRWWELHFSALGADAAFNVTLIVAGVLVATIGSYIGRDLHRWFGDDRIRSTGTVVALFAAIGAALAGVGVFPVTVAPLGHYIAAFGALALFAVATVAVTLVIPGPPRAMLLTSIGAAAGIIVAVVLWRPFDVYSAAGLEAVVVGIVFVWLTALVRTLAAGAPGESRPSDRSSLMRSKPFRAPD